MHARTLTAIVVAIGARAARGRRGHRRSYVQIERVGTPLSAGTHGARSVRVGKRSQVLVVEDDPAVQESLCELFAREGYEVALANNGAEAIELMEEGATPCCVLVDLLMPGIVGHEFLDYMSREDRVADTPLAIITGSPYLAPEGYRMFVKPLDMRALLDFVGSHCTIDRP